MKSGNCTACHQLGTIGTRRIPEELGDFESSVDAWDRRIQSGQAGAGMSAGFDRMGRQVMLEMFADWTDRIAAGEAPPAPPRPQGVERNVVVTVWDWADPKAYLHDEASTDRRNPTVNANGPIYGALEASADYVPVLDPVSHTVSQVGLTVRDPSTRPASGPGMLQPSPYWGDEPIWTSKNNVHNPMLDERGRVWLTSTVRPPDNPKFCREGSDHPSAKLFPTARARRHLAMYDPETEELTHISTCFSTHHLMFAEDEDNTLWTSGGGQVVGWLNTRMFEETGDEEASQGWDGARPRYQRQRDAGRLRGAQPAGRPHEGQEDRGRLLLRGARPRRFRVGDVTGLSGRGRPVGSGLEPAGDGAGRTIRAAAGRLRAPIEGFSPRGGDVDRNGVMWAALASGHMASFDRSKCTGPLNGPAATGRHCPEGWTFYEEPLPQIQGVTTSGSAEASYYTWIDQFNTLGLGENVPINTGNASEGLLALVDGAWVVLRVPYPLGFYTKWMDGRIDDPEGAGRRRGLWATVSTRAPFHMEGGKGTPSKVMKFQLRPDPLAR